MALCLVLGQVLHLGQMRAFLRIASLKVLLAPSSVFCSETELRGRKKEEVTISAVDHDIVTTE